MAIVVQHCRKTFFPAPVQGLGAKCPDRLKPVEIILCKSNGFLNFHLPARLQSPRTCFVLAFSGDGSVALIRGLLMAFDFCCCAAMLLGFTACCWPCRSRAKAAVSTSGMQITNTYSKETQFSAFNPQPRFFIPASFFPAWIRRYQRFS
jgi:hypothetical protein